jgi:hypothetical protein
LVLKKFSVLGEEPACDELRRIWAHTQSAACLIDRQAREAVWRNRFEEGLSIELPVLIKEVAPLREQCLVTQPKRTVQVSEESFSDVVEDLKGIIHG